MIESEDWDTGLIRYMVVFVNLFPIERHQ